mgnify:CR=1 FL=1
MVLGSDKILIFHPALAQYFKKFQDKIIDVNFGDFRTFILSKDNPTNPTFLPRYQNWLENRSVEGPDIVFIGEYKSRKNINWLYEFALKNKMINVLIIAHKMPIETNVPENIFIHRESKIFSELDIVLRNSGLIGFVAHDNYSVPTVLHVYADYDMPVLGYDIIPVSCILNHYNCGVTFNNLESIISGYQEIRANYNFYSAGMRRLALENTWEKSAMCHKTAFDITDACFK